MAGGAGARSASAARTSAPSPARCTNVAMPPCPFSVNQLRACSGRAGEIAVEGWHSEGTGCGKREARGGGSPARGGRGRCRTGRTARRRGRGRLRRLRRPRTAPASPPRRPCRRTQGTGPAARRASTQAAAAGGGHGGGACCGAWPHLAVGEQDPCGVADGVEGLGGRTRRLRGGAGRAENGP